MIVPEINRSTNRIQNIASGAAHPDLKRISINRLEKNRKKSCLTHTIQSNVTLLKLLCNCSLLYLSFDAGF